MQNISVLGQGANIFTDGIGTGSAIVNVTNGGQFFNNVGGNINMTTLSNRLAIGIVPSLLWSFAKNIVVGFAIAHPLMATASVVGFCGAMMLQPVRDAVCKVCSKIVHWVMDKLLAFNGKLFLCAGIALLIVKSLQRTPCAIIGLFSNIFGGGDDLCKVLSSETVIGSALSGAFGKIFGFATGMLNNGLWFFGSKCVCDLMIIGLIKYGAPILNWVFRPWFELEGKQQYAS